jgi:hypothetical protein
MDANNRGNPDPIQLAYANEQGRVIVTHNKRDYILLYKHFLAENRNHCGIIISQQLTIGTLLKRLLESALKRVINKNLPRKHKNTKNINI